MYLQCMIYRNQKYKDVYSAEDLKNLSLTNKQMNSILYIRIDILIIGMIILRSEMVPDTLCKEYLR